MPTTPLFDLGQTVITPGALLALMGLGESPQDYLARHHHGDWVLMEEDDRLTNAAALTNGERILS